MIKRKIILDKRGIWNKKIITLILVIFVVASVFIFLFKTDINNFLRNLPGYSVPEEDEEINVSDLTDEELRDLCPVEVGKINIPEGGILGIGSKQHIYIDGEKTNLYWDADEKEGDIKIFRGGLFKGDVKVANIANGEVSIDSGFFIEINEKKFFNYDSDIYQKIKDYISVPYLVKLHNSYYVSGNLICAGEEEEIEIDYGEPEEIPILVECESDSVCENAGYKYCVEEFCESGQIGSLCDNDEDCDKGTCVKRQQDDLGFCGYVTHSNCEEFRGDDKDMCYCEGCNCGYYEINVGQAEEMSDGTKWICNDIFEHIMPQLGFLAPCYYADECESGNMTSNTFDLKYGGDWFSPNRCL